MNDLTKLEDVVKRKDVIELIGNEYGMYLPMAIMELSAVPQPK